VTSFARVCASRFADDSRSPVSTSIPAVRKE
jgi:hypothetical protein